MSTKYNPYARLLALIPNPPLQVGTVLEYNDGVALLSVPGGGIALARGETTVGAQVFFIGDSIQGPAPTLTLEVIEL